LAADVGKAFFSWSSAEPVFVFSVFDFAAGDAARPRGASTFGRLRDAIGRTYAALRATLTIGAPAAIGVVLRRMIQSLAIGGDAGGAAIDVAEHAPRKRRGSLTSSVQTKARGGVAPCLIVVAPSRFRRRMKRSTTGDGGRRFGLDAGGVNESSELQRTEAAGATSEAPMSAAFGRWENQIIALAALSGATAGQGAIRHVAPLHALFFLTRRPTTAGSTAAWLA
jgi:hypothetical protein